MNFDYIIVGAGSAGCVLANRLTEQGDKNVLLLEAGGRDRSPLIHIPAGWAANFKNPNVDWGYSTEPEKELADRSIYWPRGKVLGGSSAINGMVYVRGAPLDYDSWAQAGNRGWGWDEVLPYFKKAENWGRGGKGKQEEPTEDAHGRDGPLSVQDVRDRRRVQDAFVDALVEAGLPRSDDFNAGEQLGAGHYQFTQVNGRRHSTATAYLKPARRRKNLTIETNAQVQRIGFSNDHKRAESVEYLQRGKVHRAHASNHVILCGGAINSPQLLELSGVGQTDRLKKLGIAAVHELPGVGENLQDHLLVPMVYGCPDNVSINREVEGWRLLPTALKWLLLRRGSLTTGSAPVGGFFYTRADLEAPDVQLHFASGSTLYNEAGKIRPTPEAGMTAVVNQSRPLSRGHLHIRSSDPAQYPAIHANYLSEELDRTTLLAAVKFMSLVFESDALAPYRLERMSPTPGATSDEELMEHIRQTASTVYHPVGTCKMGSDAQAVVDDRLRVHGIDGLMVADASIMPLLVSGNTNAASIMIAEKAADFLLA